jgi:hypothetical protein
VDVIETLQEQRGRWEARCAELVCQNAALYAQTERLRHEKQQLTQRLGMLCERVRAMDAAYKALQDAQLAGASALYPRSPREAAGLELAA